MAAEREVDSVLRYVREVLGRIELNVHYVNSVNHPSSVKPAIVTRLAQERPERQLTLQTEVS